MAEVLHDRRFGADVSRRETCCIQFIQLRLVHAHGIGVDRRTFQLAGQRQDHARVDTAGKIRADWNISPQSFLDGLEQKRLEIVNESVRIFAPFLRTLIGKIHFPKRSLLHYRTRTASVCGKDAKKMARWQKLDTFKTRSRTGHGAEREDVIDAAAIWAHRDHA